MREVKNILLINEALSQNIGDRAIAGGLNAAIVSVFGSATTVSKFWLQKGVFVQEQAGTASGEKKSDNMSMRANMLYHLLWSARYLYRMLFCIGRIRRMDLAIFGGGSLIMDNRLQFPTAMYFLGILLNLFRIPYAVSGVSLSGEIKGPAAYLFKKFLAGAAHIDMRDPISRAKAQAMFGIDVAVGSDYAFCLQEPMQGAPQRKYDFLLNITSAIKNRDEYVDFVSRFLAHFHDKNILIATTGDVGDELLAAQIHGKFNRPGLDILCAKSYREYCHAAAAADQVIASRLHAGILAVAMCTPTIVLNVGYKQQGFFTGIGLERRVFDFTAPVSALIAVMESISPSERAGIAKKQSTICMDNIGKIIERV